jgi:hypothetical protein
LRKIAALLLMTIFVWTVAYAEKFKNGVELERGGPFPEIRIKKLMIPEDYKSLALSVEVGNSFSISEIPGDILLVEFFNRSCLSCLDQVPHLNSLVDTINNGTFSSEVKVLGIAAGDDEERLLKFLKNENPKYAITADPEMEHLFTLGKPEGTPLILILKRSDEGGWLAMDSHLGIVTARELRRKIKAIAKDSEPPDEEIIALPVNREAPPEEVGNPTEHAMALLTRIIGKEANALKVEVDYPWEVFQGVDSTGKLLDLFVIVGTRYPLCDLCHESVFAVAFNKVGLIKGFAPIYVTGYGNEKWGEVEAAFMEKKLIGESVKSLSLRPDVDAVSGATLSSMVIFDEVKKTAKLLPLLP